MGGTTEDEEPREGKRERFWISRIIQNGYEASVAHAFVDTEPKFLDMFLGLL